MGRLKTGARLVATTLCVAAATTGCFFYDSRWGQETASQRRVAQQAKPAKLDEPKERPVRRDIRTLTVRAHATPAYRAATLDWKQALEKVIDDANRILEPAFGVRAALSSAADWQPGATDDDTKGLWEELLRTDDGEGAEWVIGLIGSTPRLAVAFDTLGQAKVRGKHILIRATNDARDREYVEMRFDELTVEERARMLAERRHHKNLAVLLHEIGHTLGALHVADKRFVMNEKYDAKMAGFSPDNQRLMRLVLHYRLDEAGGAKHTELARALVGALEATEGPWVAAEREETLRRLREQLGAADRSASARERAVVNQQRAAERTVAPAALTGIDRQAFKDAQHAFAAERYDEAARALDQISEAARDHPSVQDLRCRIVMKQGAPYAIIRQHCANQMQLTPWGSGAPAPAGSKKETR